MSRPGPLDEYPVHQAPLYMRHPVSSDRNFYDRCIFQAHDRTGDIVLITGLGVYPNLGVIDAYATVRRGDRQVAVRMSHALGDDRMEQRVGPYRIEVLEPLRQVRLVCDADEHGVAFDLTFTAAFPPIDEPQHVARQADTILLEAKRFAQVGGWDGELRVEGESYLVTSDRWVATRDRSWGIRPSGEAPPAGRIAAESPTEGFWWTWVPLRFDDFALMVIAQEDADGHRILNHAVRVWPDGGVEQLGWPEFDVRYRSGSRHADGAAIHVVTRERKPLTLDVDTLTSIPLNVGCGYGGDPDWNHGLWKGRDWIDSSVYDLNDPAVAGRIPFTPVDHVARATFDGQEGWGIFEHGSFGRHDPSGFAGWDSVAP